MASVYVLNINGLSRILGVQNFYLRGLWDSKDHRFPTPQEIESHVAQAGFEFPM